MVTIDRDSGIIRFGDDYTFDYHNFYNAFHKAACNSNHYDYYWATVKHYSIKDKFSVGILPLPDYKEPQESNTILSGNSYFTFRLLNTKPPQNHKDFYDEEFASVVSGSEKLKRENLLRGNCIERPKIWEKEDDKIFLNETFKMDYKRLRDGLEDVLKNSLCKECDEYEFEQSNIKIRYRDEKRSFNHCNFCGLNKNLIYLTDSSLIANKLPCSTICLDCLPRFMSDYLDYSADKASRLIVTPEI